MAQTLYNIQQGESKLVEVEVVDGGNNVDLVTDVVKVYAEIYSGGDLSQRKRFCTQVTSGANQMSVNATANYILDIPLERSVTKDLKEGRLFIDIITEKTDNAFPSNLSYEEYSKISFGEIRTGYLKDSDIC